MGVGPQEGGGGAPPVALPPGPVVIAPLESYGLESCSRSGEALSRRRTCWRGESLLQRKVLDMGTFNCRVCLSLALRSVL